MVRETKKPLTEPVSTEFLDYYAFEWYWALMDIYEKSYCEPNRYSN